MSSHIYVEGGGDSRELQIRCREGFEKLFRRRFSGRMPKFVPCGGRNSAFDAFKTALENAKESDFVALLIDSEDPIGDIEATWEHLKSRDNWDRPDGAINEQVLLMTTSMETWIISDRETLAEHYGSDLQESALLSLHELETRLRHVVFNALVQATRNCRNAYTKGKRSFEILAKLNPETLSRYLPSFVRVCRILDASL